jgi:hypothetical protein
MGSSYQKASASPVEDTPSETEGGPQTDQGMGNAAEILRVATEALSQAVNDGLLQIVAEEVSASAGNGAAPAASESASADPTGIATEAAVGRFVSAGKSLEADWADLDMTARAERLTEAANAELGAIGIPPLEMQLHNLGDDHGVFRSKLWAMHVNWNPFIPNEVTSGDVEIVAMTVYHEARHAEQWFRMARLMAGQGKPSTDIASTLGLPEAIVAEAVKDPLDAGGGAEAQEASVWLDSRVGPGKEKAKEVMAELRAAGAALDEAIAAYERVEKKPLVSKQRKAELAAAVDAAYERFNKAHEAYSALPVEADAWEVTEAVEAAYA